MIRSWLAKNRRGWCWHRTWFPFNSWCNDQHLEPWQWTKHLVYWQWHSRFVKWRLISAAHRAVIYLSLDQRFGASFPRANKKYYNRLANLWKIREIWLFSVDVQCGWYFITLQLNCWNSIKIRNPVLNSSTLSYLSFVTVRKEKEKKKKKKKKRSDVRRESYRYASFNSRGFVSPGYTEARV